MAGAAGGSTRWCFVQEGGSDTREGRSRWDLLSVCASHWIRLLYNRCSTMYRVLKMCIYTKIFTVGNVLYFKLNCTHARYTVCYVKKCRTKILCLKCDCVFCVCVEQGGGGIRRVMADRSCRSWTFIIGLINIAIDQPCNRWQWMKILKKHILWGGNLFLTYDQSFVQTPAEGRGYEAIIASLVGWSPTATFGYLGITHGYPGLPSREALVESYRFSERGCMGIVNEKDIDKDMLIMMWREEGWEALLSGFITFLLNPPATALFSCRFLKIIIVICSS